MHRGVSAGRPLACAVWAVAARCCDMPFIRDIFDTTIFIFFLFISQRHGSCAGAAGRHRRIRAKARVKLASPRRDSTLVYYYNEVFLFR